MFFYILSFRLRANHLFFLALWIFYPFISLTFPVSYFYFLPLVPQVTNGKGHAQLYLLYYSIPVMKLYWCMSTCMCMCDSKNFYCVPNMCQEQEQKLSHGVSCNLHPQKNRTPMQQLQWWSPFHKRLSCLPIVIQLIMDTVTILNQ